MEKAKQAFGRLQSAVNALTAVILVAIMAIILVQTFTRYVIFTAYPGLRRHPDICSWQ